ncbi:MAG: hypothetical protein D5S00_06450 [Tindallia sp. MSAO_Bac2]|nr:MAG: hypothetical protein D5S00_06450 [Tindallia sp. MSAO_Bac2]
MKYRLSGKICLISLIVLLSLGIWGCADDEGSSDPQSAEEQNTEEIEEIGETCWTELALSDSIDTSFIIEGMEEQVTLSLFQSNQYSYAIYFDDERYQWREENGKDFLIPHHKPDDQDLWMAIWHDNEDVEQVLEKKKVDLEASFADTVMEEIRDPLMGTQLTARQHQESDDVIEIWYFVEAQDSGIFIIQQKLFTEAVEGHGRRFDLFLENFFGAKSPGIQLTLTEEAKAQMKEELLLEENQGKVHTLIPGSS